jgi:hypothetical protein
MKVRAAVASGQGVDGVHWLWDREPRPVGRVTFFDQGADPLNW